MYVTVVKFSHLFIVKCLVITLLCSFLTVMLFIPQVARAGRFGTKGLAITFVSDETDAKTLNDVQDRFEVNVAELPDEIDISSYSKSSAVLKCARFILLHPTEHFSMFTL